jgi:tRNA threonylcarbamoyl adenosine modification protein YeaZ
MAYLLIDTSSEEAIVAVMGDEGIPACSITPHGNQLSQTLVPTIQHLLAHTGLVPKDLTRVVAGMGPGSYTGTRVGVIVAKSLSFALGIPFEGFCSLLAFLPDVEGRFAAVLPAKSGSFFLLKGLCRTRLLHQESASLVSSEVLRVELEGSDFVVAPSREELPSFEKPFYSPAANLNVLPYLNASSLTTTPIYLHESWIPFEKISPLHLRSD